MFPGLCATTRVLPYAKKQMAANSVRCPPDRGESVKVGYRPPFTIKQLESRIPKGFAIPEPGGTGRRVPRPRLPPAPGSPCGSRRTSESGAQRRAKGVGFELCLTSIPTQFLVGG